MSVDPIAWYKRGYKEIDLSARKGELISNIINRYFTRL